MLKKLFIIGALIGGTSAYAQTYTLETISDMRVVDPVTGKSSNVGLQVELRGIAHCANFRTSGGYDFPLVNPSTGEGIKVFGYSDLTPHYNFYEGDSLHVFGEIEQYRGLMEIVVDSIEVVGTAFPTATPEVVTTLDEYSENRLVTLEGLTLVDSAQWTTGVGTGGFTVEVTNGVDNFDIRINSATDAYNQPAPSGSFNITGWGGQFDFDTAIILNAYQITPCTYADITPFTSIGENKEFSLSIFPNPAKEILNIQSEVKIKTVSVYNVLGEKVAEISINNQEKFTIPVRELESGNYFLSAQGTTATVNKQFVVVK